MKRRYPEITPQSAEVWERIRLVLEQVTHAEPHAMDQALERIMDVVDPFRQSALEELARFRATFVELAK